MGSSFIITKSMLKNKGNELMLQFYESIHNDDYLATSISFREQKKYWDDNVVEKYKKVVLKDLTIYANNIYTRIVSADEEITLDNVDLRKLDNDEDILKYIEHKIKSETIELKFVFEFLNDIDEKLNFDKFEEFESHEDLFCLKKAFLKAYDLLHNSGYNLE